MNAGYSVEVVETTEGFAVLAEAWDDLIARSGTASVFSTHDWLWAWWGTFGSGKRLSLLVARDGGGTVQGIAPLYCARERRGGLPYRAVRFIGGEKVGSDYLDFITADDAGEAVTEALLDRLLQDAGSWDVAFLTDLLDSSATTARLRGAAARTGNPFALQPRYSCPYLALSEGGIRKERIVSAKLASNLRRGMKRLSARRAATIERCTDPEGLRQRLETLFAFHDRRLGAASNFVRPEVRDFHHRTAALFLRRGLLQFFTLLADGQPIAIVYGVRFKDRFYFYQTSFDPDWREFGPGAVLLGHCVEFAADQGLTDFDLLRGDEKYKLEMTKLSRTTVTCILGSRSVRGRVSYRYLLGYQRARQAAGRTLRGFRGAATGGD